MRFFSSGLFKAGTLVRRDGQEQDFYSVEMVDFELYL